MPDVGSIVAIVGCIIAVTTFSFQIISLFRERKKDQKAIDEALDRQPYIKQQLELGNWGTAIEQLNKIIVTQAKHIDRVEKENADLRTENTDLEMRVEFCERRIRELEGGHNGRGK
jgi:predicted  nucleic acid-binding Zn-ribbon protein